VALLKLKIQVNPLLMTRSKDDTGVFLKWDMLWASSSCLRSDNPPNYPWMQGRNEPATFPRLSALQIVSNAFPWTVDIMALDEDIGVTCGDVIDSLDSYLHRPFKWRDLDALPTHKTNAVMATYRLNRTAINEGPEERLGEDICFVDWLGKDTIFGGINLNEEVVEEYYGIPTIFELRCNPSEFLTNGRNAEELSLGGELGREVANTSSRING
jgi:hypothetical protein